MFAERCFSRIVHNLLETSPARSFIIFPWLGQCIVHFMHQDLRVAGASHFTCVQLDEFCSSFLIVFFRYTEYYPNFQHLVVSPTVWSTHCSCATEVLPCRE